MEYDQLIEHLNTFGWYHLLILVIVGLCHSFVNFNNLNVNFMAQHVDHWCFVPELAHLPASIQKELSIPWDNSTGGYAQCLKYDRVWNVTSLEDGSDTGLPLVACQQGWAYEDADGRTTVQMEWDLVCDRAWMTDLFSPLFVLGCFAGSLMAGNLATKLGRKKCFLLLVTCMMLCGIAAALSVNVIMFLVSRTLLGVFLIGIISVGYIIVAEVTPPRARDAAGLAYMLFYPVGAMSVGGIAYLIPQWRHLQLTCALVCAPALLVFMWVVPESSRWLAFNGMREEAAAVLSKIATLNGHPIPTAEIQEYILPKRPRNESVALPGNEASAKDVILNPTVRLFFIAITLAWTSAVFMYSGVSYNLDGLFPDTSLTLLVCGILEMVFLVLSFVLLRKVGRKVPVFLFFTIAALGSLVAVFALTYNAPGIVISVISLLCRSSGAGISMVCMFMSVELFPTSIRNIVIGYASAICYIFTSVAPVVCGTMTEYWEPIPYAVFGISSLLSIALVTQLPETKDMPSPETIPAMEALRRSGFSCSLGLDPNALTKQNLVYVAESSIVQGLAGRAIEPKELEMIQETIQTQRQRSLRKIPSVGHKPVFIVVPEGTSLAAVDNFVLQEMEPAVGGESVEGRSYAHHRVYDLDSFRSLSHREKLRTTSVAVTSPMSVSPPRDITKGTPRDQSPPPKYDSIVADDILEKLNSFGETLPGKKGSLYKFDPETGSINSSVRSSRHSSMRSNALQRCNSIESRRSFVNALFEDEYNHPDFHRRDSVISQGMDPLGFVPHLPALISAHQELRATLSQEPPMPSFILPAIPEDQPLSTEQASLPVNPESSGLAQGIISQSYTPSLTGSESQHQGRSVSFYNPLPSVGPACHCNCHTHAPMEPALSFSSGVRLPEYHSQEALPEVVLSIPEIVVGPAKYAVQTVQPLHQVILEELMSGSPKPNRFFMRF